MLHDCLWTDLLNMNQSNDQTFPPNFKAFDSMDDFRLIAMVSSFLTRERTKVIFVDETGDIYHKVSSIEFFQQLREEGRLSCSLRGVNELSSLKESDFFHGGSPMAIPTASETRIIRIVMKKMIDPTIFK
jgi:hypothetical protein